MTSAPPKDRARELLAPLYGEADALGLREASEFEAARDFLADALAEPLDAAVRSRMAGAMQREASADAPPVAVQPVGGPVWSLLGDGSPLPLARRESVGVGAAIVVPDGSRALLTYRDGTTVLLDARSRMMPRPGGSGAAPGGSLSRGRLYARVRRQASGRFSIDTPAGRVAVLGTEFDLAVGGANRMALLVAKGVVEYALHSRSEPARRVRRGESLSVEDSRTESRRVGALEIRRRTAWARTGGGLGRIIKRRAIAAAVAVVLAAGASLWMRPGNEAPVAVQPAVPAGIEGERGLSGVDLPPPVGILQPSESRDWRATVRTSEFGNDAWIPERETVALLRVGDPGADGSRDIECFIREMVELDSQGMPIEETQVGFAQLATMPVRFHVAGDGTIGAPSMHGVADLTWVTGDMVVSVLEHEMLHVASRLRGTVGASVSKTSEGTFPQDPSGRFETVRELRVESVDGDRIVARASGTTRIDDLTVKGLPRRGVDTVRVVEWRETRFKGTVEIDRATGIPVRSVIETQRAEQHSLRMTETGKEPVVNRLPVESGGARVETTIEPMAP